MICLTDLKELPDDYTINASSHGTLAIERFKLAMALDPADPQTEDLREKLVEDA